MERNGPNAEQEFVASALGRPKGVKDGAETPRLKRGAQELKKYEVRPFLGKPQNGIC